MNEILSAEAMFGSPFSCFELDSLNQCDAIVELSKNRQTFCRWTRRGTQNGKTTLSCCSQIHSYDKTTTFWRRMACFSSFMLHSAPVWSVFSVLWTKLGQPGPFFQLHGPFYASLDRFFSYTHHSAPVRTVFSVL